MKIPKCPANRNCLLCTKPRSIIPAKNGEICVRQIMVMVSQKIKNRRKK